MFVYDRALPRSAANTEPVKHALKLHAENGPCNVLPDGQTTELNPFRWAPYPRLFLTLTFFFFCIAGIISAIVRLSVLSSLTNALIC